MPTPDDLAGGLTDADKLLLNDAGETADNPGETVYTGGSFQMRDSAGVFNPRTGGAAFDEKVKVTANDTTADYLLAKLVGAGGITITEKDDGSYETIEISTGASARTARLPAPSTPSLGASNGYAERAGMVYEFAEFDGAASQRWVGYLEFNAGNSMEIRIVRASDGAIVGPEVSFTADGIAVVPITQNLPTADDAYLVQNKKTGGGGGPRILAGLFEIAGIPAS